MTDRVVKAFEFAQESVKQLIGLATGIIALSITFSKEFASHPDSAKSLAMWAWGFLFVSVVVGVWTLNALTGSLDPMTHREDETTPSINGWNVRIPALLQILLFLIGLFLIVRFGALSI